MPMTLLQPGVKARFAAVVALLLAVGLAGCGRKAPPTTSTVVALRVGSLPSDGADPAWARAPLCVVTLLPQDIVEPRLLKASTPLLNVRALSDGVRLAFRLEWNDSTRSDLPGAARFSDACAIQFPQTHGADLPAPQMGEAGRAVEISYWSSAWQARVDGRTEDINELYPGTPVGHYPFEAEPLKPRAAEQQAMALRYAPAKHRGNWMAGDSVPARGRYFHRLRAAWRRRLERRHEPQPAGPGGVGGRQPGGVRRLGRRAPGSGGSEDEIGLDPAGNGRWSMTVTRKAPELFLREAAEWRLIGLLFERPRGDWWRDVASLAAELPDDALRQAAAAAAEADQGGYLRLLGPGGLASPRESAWRGRRDPAAILSEIRAFHGAFAFNPTAEDPPDHVAVEAAFAGYLSLKCAYAAARGRSEDLELASGARSSFVNEHLRSFALPLGERLARAGGSWLLAAAEALLARTGPPDQECAPDCDPADQVVCGLDGGAAVPESPAFHPDEEPAVRES